MTSSKPKSFAARALLVGAILAGCAPQAAEAPTDDNREVNGKPAAGNADVPSMACVPAVAEHETRIGAMSACPAQGTAGTIPVLLFHQICEESCAPTDGYGMTRAEFRRTMIAIKEAGFTAISMEDFVRAHRGDARGLPARPILITFDDGRIDGYLGADGVLEELGLLATMFILTIQGAENSTFYMSWSQIMTAAASGRWTIQLHAHAGHSRVPVGVDTTGAPVLASFYAWRRCDPAAGTSCPALESFDDWKVRAEEDIDRGISVLTSKFGASQALLSMALPFGDYGQFHSNDARIAPELRSFLDSRFAVWFTQPSRDPEFMTPSLTTHEVPRFTIASTATAESVLAWLTKHSKM